MARFPRPRPISVAKQGAALSAKIPGSQARVRSSRLRWTACVCPSPLSRKYDIEVSYSLASSPRVRVLRPELRTREGESLPHVYGDGSLCLYYRGDWSRSLLLAETVLPWAVEWLLHYEVWLATGTWRGEGIHPSKAKPLKAYTPE